MSIHMPDFSKKQHYIKEINPDSNVMNIADAKIEDYEYSCSFFENSGYIKAEENNSDFHYFKSYKNDDSAVFINYFVNTKELCISHQKNYIFKEQENDYKTITTPEITQLHLVDFGMSYTIRLSDGRFIVIDGGWDFKPDAESLYNHLKEKSPFERPVIATWIMTHAHLDHYRCFNKFTELYSNEVSIESFMYYFPVHGSQDSEYNLSRLLIKDPDYPVTNTCEKVHMQIMHENMKKYNVPIYTPHTGQKYKIADAEFEFLACVDDTFHLTGDSNSFSLIFKMELGGQVILWTGDASFGHANLANRYGNYLKSDILQIPHHGFASGDDEQQIDAYELIKPDVCLLPVSDNNAFVLMDTYIKPSSYFMTKLGIKELITGEETRTLRLPYTAPAYGEHELLCKYTKGRKANGAETWMFTNLNSSNPEDFKFDILNFSKFELTVSIDIIFETPSDTISAIITSVPGTSIKMIDILNKVGVITDPYFMNHNDIDKKGIPENAKFAIRFLSDRPFVVSAKNNGSEYHF